VSAKATKGHANKAIFKDVENELKNENIVLLLYKLYNLSIYLYLIR
jgi:hypothetical protein